VATPSTADLNQALRLAIRAARFEMEPKWIEVLRELPSEVKLSNANALWLTARDMLYFQERAKGLAEIDARRSAARRLLLTNG
jgi:hypothetical protein